MGIISSHLYTITGFQLPNTGPYSDSVQYMKIELLTSFNNAVNYAFKKRIVRFLKRAYDIERRIGWELVNDSEPIEYIRALCNGVEGQLK